LPGGSLMCKIGKLAIYLAIFIIYSEFQAVQNPGRATIVHSKSLYSSIDLSII